MVIVSIGLTKNRVQATSSKYDFGDAPDAGYFTYYGSNGASLGSFPSFLASNGARVSETDQVWLGDTVSTEADAKLINGDAGDDGISVSLKSCQTSTAKVIVHVANPGETSGTAYLNMFFDWNKDGTWSGADDCADEWAVRNFPIDLGAQDETLQLVVPEFMAGKKIKDVWYRAVITKDQRLTYESQNGQGEFTAGEVEDYGPTPAATGKKFGAVCTPDLLIIKHGKTGTFTIKRKPGSVPIADALLANSVTAKTGARKINDTGLSFTYESSQVDGPLRVVWETVQVKVRFIGKTATKLVNCNVAVVHGKVPSTPQDLGDFSTTEITGDVTNTGDDQATTLSGNFTLTDDTLVARGVYGIEIPLTEQIPGLESVPTEMVTLTLSGGNCVPCAVDADNKKLTCLGTEPILPSVESFFDIFFGAVAADLEALHLHLLDSAGDVVAATDLPVK
ncbi:MAG: Cell surface protein [uncultured bacterium]|nr:MAG: Cell surface protein [uncultured bacterium]